MPSRRAAANLGWETRETTESASRVAPGLRGDVSHTRRHTTSNAAQALDRKTYGSVIHADPNCRAMILKGHILYISKRWIEKGEELTVDYHFPKDVERVVCKCGTAKCRGTINVK